MLAMGLDETAARSVLRFSVAETNDAAELRTLLNTLPAAVHRARAAAAYA